MKKNLISIIIPCYNVEKYVKRCLESIINQTYKKIEIIVVEDCSTDSTYEILKKIKKKDNRIKLIKNESNGGLSYSRNRGLDLATGDYIGFIDSDDYVDLDYYEKMMDSIIKEKSEIAVCDIKVVYESIGKQLTTLCYDGDEFNLLTVINSGLSASACNKLFKKEIIKKNKFAVGKANEDIAVVVPALVDAKKISYAKTYYYYIQRTGSIQNSSFSDKRFDIFIGVQTTLERIKKDNNYNIIMESLVYTQLITLFLFVIPKEKSFFKRIKILKKYHKLVENYNIANNKYLKKFIDGCGKKHQVYYKLLIKFTTHNLYFLASSIIGCYNFLYKFMRNKVIPDNITMQLLIEKAKLQKKLKDCPLKISVIIPNYNYARFMKQRLYSILSQNIKIHEIIILDDKSIDNSLEEINAIVKDINKYVNIKTIYNNKNSGSAFKQWKKGFENASGDYVWIAEADDYCDDKLLSNLIKPVIKNHDITISYCDTAFIDEMGAIILKSIKPEINIKKSKHWDNDYCITGIEEFNKYSFLNNTIANVSSCIIKRDNYSNYLKIASDYKQAGDWLFYVSVMINGKISYKNKTLNYYRVHGTNVSSTMDYTKHLQELNNVYDYFKKNIGLNKNQEKLIKERIKFLKKTWKVK